MHRASVDPEEARAAFSEERRAAGGCDVPVAIDGVARAVVTLHQVEDFTSFFAEYGLVGSDIVLHFFLSPEARDMPERERYFLEVFPRVLSDLSEAYFRATQPRVFAEYVPEMTSWYMRCRGFADRLDPHLYVLEFLEKLDARLDEGLNSASSGH
jgi:hypothetical protein